MFSLKSIRAYIKKRKSSRSKKSLSFAENANESLQVTPNNSDRSKSLEGYVLPSEKSPELENIFPELLYEAYHHPEVLVIRCDLKMEVPGHALQEMGVQRVFTTPIRAKPSQSSISSEIQVDISSAPLSPPSCSPQPELCTDSPSPSQSISSITASSSSSVSNYTLALAPRVGDALRLLDFAEVAFINAGSFGKVHLVQHRGTRMEVALKSVRKDPEIERAIRKEQRSLCELSGTRGVIELLASFHDENNYYLVTPFYERGDLSDEIHRWGGCLPLELATFYAAEILLGMQAIHNIGIVHRDIKPDNILIDGNGHAVIADFGLAMSVVPEGAIYDPEGRHIMLSEPGGTYEYIAPEEWMGKEYSFSVDVFAFGVTVFEMFVGRAIWRRQEDDDYLDMAKRTVMGTLEAWLGMHTLPTEAAYMMLQNILKSDAAHRPQIKELMTHPFFHRIKWEKLSRGEVQPPDVGEPPLSDDDVSADPDKDDDDNDESAAIAQCPYTPSFMEVDGGMFYEGDNDPFPEFNFTCEALRSTEYDDGGRSRFDPLLVHGSSASLLYAGMSRDCSSPSPSRDAQVDDAFFDIPLTRHDSLHRVEASDSDGRSSCLASLRSESPPPSGALSPPRPLPPPCPSRSSSDDSSEDDDDDNAIIEILFDGLPLEPEPEPEPALKPAPKPEMIFEVIHAPALPLVPSARRDARLPAAGELAVSALQRTPGISSIIQHFVGTAVRALRVLRSFFRVPGFP